MSTNRFRMTLWTVWLVGCAAASDSQQTGQTAPPTKAVVRPAKWNGGKPHAPVQVVSSLSGEVAGQGSVSVTLTVTPLVDCRQVTTRVRGVRGVEAELPGFDHGALHAGQPVTRTALARVGDGGAGYLVVDVTLTLADGSQSSASQSFELHAPGATRLPASKRELGQDSRGRSIILMPAQTR